MSRERGISILSFTFLELNASEQAQFMDAAVINVANEEAVKNAQMLQYLASCVKAYTDARAGNIVPFFGSVKKTVPAYAEAEESVKMLSPASQVKVGKEHIINKNNMERYAIIYQGTSKNPG
jgi:hypothetical protein